MNLAIPQLEMLYLKTRRLRLEPITENHAQELVELFADDGLHTFVPFMAPTLREQLERCRRWANRLSPQGDEIWLNWAARDLASGKVLGHFQSGYKDDRIASIGYVVARNFQRQGVAFEALSKIFLFLRDEIGVREIRAWSDTRNKASHRLAEKLGMTQIEVVQNADFFKGSSSDEYVFAIKYV